MYNLKSHRGVHESTPRKTLPLGCTCDHDTSHGQATRPSAGLQLCPLGVPGELQKRTPTLVWGEIDPRAGTCQRNCTYF